MQYTFRDILERHVGTAKTDTIFYEAGYLAGQELYKKFFSGIREFGDFLSSVRTTLKDMGVGIMRVEKADMEKKSFVITVSEDLECSGLPELDYEVCVYDEGFLAALLTALPANDSWSRKSIAGARGPHLPVYSRGPGRVGAMGAASQLTWTSGNPPRTRGRPQWSGIWPDRGRSPAPSAPPSRLEGIEGLEDLALTLAAMRSFADRLAAGDLSGELPARGYFPGTLKMLQANLRHLAWQTSRIAAGDLTQHVDFMGDFSQAFNAMVERLKDSLAALRLSERKYRKLAITDNLTGLYNPRYFFTIAGREFRRALRHRRPLAVIMLDVDDFKAINDRHGHAVGDMALREIAQVLGNPLRGTDLLARYGGEEFIVLLPDTGCQAAVAVAEKLRENVEGCLIGGRLKITASFGHAASRPSRASGCPRPGSWK
jgi:diguanylate cyclase (GGDEF)-like protein